MSRAFLNLLLFIGALFASAAQGERDMQNGRPIGISNWPEIRRYNAPPHRWEEFQLALRRGRQLVENPDVPREKREQLIKSIQAEAQLIIDDPEGSAEIIHYLVGSGLNDSNAKEVYDNIEYLQAMARAGNPTLKTLRQKTNFAKMMGWVGLDATENTPRFKYFWYASASEGVNAKDWQQHFQRAMGQIQLYDQKTHKKMGFYRATGRLVHGLAVVAGAAPGTAALFSHGAQTFGLSPDLQIAAGGMAGMWIGERLRDRIEEFGYSRVRPQLQKEAESISDAYQLLLAVDPERAAPHLISNVIDGQHDPAQKALGDLSFALLKRTAGGPADKALATLGLFMMKEGNAEMTREVYEELARRDPNGPYGRYWPLVKDYVDHLKETNINFNALQARSYWKKAGYASLPVVLGVWGAMRALTPNEFSAAVTVVRDLAIGEIVTHQGGKVLSHLTNGNLRQAMDQTTENLSQRLRLLSKAGNEGFEILTALAENKIPGRLGEVLAAAATKELRNYEGFSAPHVLARLSPRDSERPTRAMIAKQADGIMRAQQRTLGHLANCNFGALVPHGR